VSLSVLAVGLDGTVLSVALPTLSRALHASKSNLQWFSSGYLLVLAAAMLPAGRQITGRAWLSIIAMHCHSGPPSGRDARIAGRRSQFRAPGRC
jgi:MFS family permease